MNFDITYRRSVFCLFDDKAYLRLWGELIMEILTKAVRVFIGNQEILKGMDFNVHDKEFVGIIGPNGSGKSTFLKLIMHEESPSSGKNQLKAGYF